MQGIGEYCAQRRRSGERVRRLLVIVAFPCLAACATLDSLKPILADSDAVEVPGLIGSWRFSDSVTAQIRTVGHERPAYLVAIDAIEEDSSAVDPMHILRTQTRGPRRRESATRSPHPDTIRTWFDVRVGRLADRLVADFTPSGDLLLERLAKRYAGQVKLTHMLVVFELNGDRLRLFEIRPAAAYKQLRSKLCVSPFITWPDIGTPSVDLTGTSEEVRGSYECLLRQPGVVSDSAFTVHRATTH